MKSHSAPEHLESRIAPAYALPTLVNARTVTYTDGDGDLVTITLSKGFFEDPNDLLQNDFVFVDVVGGVTNSKQLGRLDFVGDTVLDGANVTITAKPSRETPTSPLRGDGMVNIGHIDATGIDLGAVNIRGDLGAIDAGDSNLKDGGLKSLTVLSLGEEGTLTGAPDLVSNIVGAVGSIRVTGDIVDASISIDGGATPSSGSLGSLFVGGSILGGGADDSGQVFLTGALGTVTIGGDLGGSSGVGSGLLQAAKFGTITIGGSVTGGSGESSGQIFAEGAISKITIGGSMIGNDGVSSSVISAQSIGTLQIDGSVFGGFGADSGKIEVDTTITTLRIGGSLIGGPVLGLDSANSGYIFVGGKLSSATIGGNIEGGNSATGFANTNTGYVDAGSIGSFTVGGSLIGGDDNGGTLTDSGVIRAVGTIGTLVIKGGIYGGDSSGSGRNTDTGYVEADRLTTMTVNGSIFSGSDASGGLFNSGAVRTWHDIGTLTVKGSLEGNEQVPVIISAFGQLTPTSTTDLAMRSISILGRVFRAEILAGYTPDLTPSFFGTALNADAQIGTVKTGGNWIASDLIAGVATGGDGFFGDTADTTIDVTGLTGGRDSLAISKISAIVIGGRVLGTSANDGERFGFGAQQIVSMKVGGVTVAPLLSGRSNDTFALGNEYPLGTTRGTTNPDGYDVHVYEV
jgi:hypothetical protein